MSRETARAARVRLVKQRKAKGLCVDCGRPKAAKWVLCQTCHDAAVAGHARSREKALREVESIRRALGGTA